MFQLGKFIAVLYMSPQTQRSLLHTFIIQYELQSDKSHVERAVKRNPLVMIKKTLVCMKIFQPFRHKYFLVD